MADKTPTTPTPEIETTIEPIETPELDNPAGAFTGELIDYRIPTDFELRRTAVELATNARESFPLTAAPGYYAFLKGETPTAETV